MLNEQTADKLIQLRLRTMADVLREQLDDPASSTGSSNCSHELSFRAMTPCARHRVGHSRNFPPMG